MERTSRENQQSLQAQSESVTGTNVQAPPTFQLQAQTAQLRNDTSAPAQLQEAEASEMEQEGGDGLVGGLERSAGAGNPLSNSGTGGVQQLVAQRQEAPAQEGAQQDTTTDTPTTTPQVAIQRSVGLNGANIPADVRQVQDRLVTLGYLSAANFQTEQADPASPTAIADNALTHTIQAIAAYFSAAFGQPGMLITPGQASATFMNAAPAQGLGSVAATGDVGRGAANAAADVRAIQARLNAIGFLSQPALTAEQVAADATGAIADANLTQTIAAINNFNIQIVGTSLFIIRANSREMELLNNPPRFRADSVSITNSVGTGGQNNPADVRAVQTRLVALGYLSTDNQTAEAPAADATAALTVAALTQTISAINQFQTSMNLRANGLVVPGDDSHRQLINPSLPERGNLNITGTVGQRGANNPADVRAIQERLQAIGILSTANFLAEKVDPTGTAAIAMTTVPHTSAAISRFCTTVAGSTDGRIDPGGRALRLLNDPTYGTTSNFNGEANNADAGYDFQSNNAAVNRIITAVEIVEAGNFQGEIGAVLTNGAGVAASFGRGQVIGGTAVGVLQDNQGIRDHYGLTDGMLTEMSDRAANTRTRYDAIYNLVPAGGSTAAALNTAITNYTTTNGQRFVEETGLGTDDIARMFHTANMRRRILAVNVPRTSGVLNQGIDVDTHVDRLLANADFAASVNYCGINRGSIRTYFRSTDTMGENKAAFQTKAIFNHPEGQRVRNAMTDNNGTAIGRTLIEDNYDAANGAVGAGVANRPRAVAAVSAIMHNRGGTARNWAGRMNEVWANEYVTRFLPHWDAAR